MTTHAKFQGATSMWVVWAISQFNVWKFVFFVSWKRPQGVSLDTPLAQYVIIRRSRQGSVSLGVRNIKFESWPLYLQKIGTPPER